MLALYDGELYYVGEDDGESVQLVGKSTDVSMWVSFGDDALVIDPTDSEIENAGLAWWEVRH